MEEYKLIHINALVNIMNIMEEQANTLLNDIRTNTHTHDEYMNKNQALLEVYANIIDVTYSIEQISNS